MVFLRFLITITVQKNCNRKSEIPTKGITTGSFILDSILIFLQSDWSKKNYGTENRISW
jgi:hypothetical protein